jgi:hypothetical protein
MSTLLLGGGSPPLVNVNDVISTLGRICNTVPIKLLYAMNKPDLKLFKFMHYYIPIDTRPTVKQNILYKVFMDIYRNTNLECWERLFKEEK